MASMTLGKAGTCHKIDVLIYSNGLIMVLTWFLVLLCVDSVCGLTCLKCDEIYQPRHCHYVEICANDEVCGAERIQTAFGSRAYKLGCVKQSTCQNNIQNGTSCGECCSNEDLCNAAACGEPGYPPSRGMACYNCEDYNRPEQCHKIAYCAKDQMCRIDRRIEFGDIIMTSSCQSTIDCWGSGSQAIIGKRFLRQSANNTTCRNCCLRDFCNADCALDPCKSSPCQHGTCSVRGTTFACICDRGWIGWKCETLEDPCSSSPCVHGTCVHTLDTLRYRCVCASGWSGQSCDQRSQASFDCLDILSSGRGSHDGIYEIQLNGTTDTVKVFCDMTTDGGGWTVFQRRFNGSVDFYRNFSEYENGFGSLEGEFWLGLKYVYNMTHDIKSDLRFDMENSTGHMIYELDRGFRLKDPPYYALFIDGFWISEIYKKYDLNMGLGYYNGKPFSTFDEDRTHYNCSVKCHGGGWYSSCSDVNPNGEYITPGTVWRKGGSYNPGYGGIIYKQWMGFKSLKATKLMFRRQ